MTYPIIPELYGIVARKLLDEIGEKSFYSGSFSFDYGWKIQCKLPPKTKRFCPLVLK